MNLSKYLSIFIIFIVFTFLLNNSLSEYFSIEDHFKKPFESKYHHNKFIPNAIFVSIASYRDDECSTTLKTLYENAYDPSRIFCGICSQNKDASEECIPPNFKYRNQISFIKLPHTEAKGPTWARYLASHLWNGEEYFLQIDSHINMIKDWDKKLIDMYKKCDSNKPILSHYPPQSIDENNKLCSYTCTSHYENDFHIISEARMIDKPDKPFVSPYASAGFIFGKSQFLHEVPFDPFLPYMFQGEEILLATRLWTNGWDIYNLNEPVSTHNYSRDEKPRFWNDNSHDGWTNAQEDSNSRYYHLINQKENIKDFLKKNIDKYGMGKERSVESWFEFAGIDPKSKKIQSRCEQKYINGNWVNK